MPHRKEPSPIAIQLRSAIVEMPVRLHPIVSSIGLTKTASANIAPRPMDTMTAPAPTTTHP
jgi:hypothetical protein